MNQQFYLGIVEDRKSDPLRLGRIKVRVFGVHSESIEDVPTAALPWAIPIMPATSASLSGIGQTVAYVEGSLVFVFFQDGDSKQQPIVLGSAAGIPQGKSPFGTAGVYTTETFEDNTPVDAEISTVFDGDGSNSVEPGVPVEAGPAAATEAAADAKKADADKANSSGDTPPPAVQPAPVADPTAASTGVDCTAAVRKYGAVVTAVYAELVSRGITNNNAAIAILSNIGKECAFVPKRENITYKTLKQLRIIFKTKFGAMPDAEAVTYLNNPEKLANFVYSNSEGNGSVGSGDGFKYRGGGFIQLTKKANYIAVGTALNIDLVSNPDLVTSQSYAGKVVAEYFIMRFGGANRLSFSGVDEALVAVTKKVNPGGFINDYPIVVTESKLYISGSKLADAQEKEISKPSNPENDVKKDATQEEINDGLISKKSITTNKLGFKDPSEKYPLASLLNEPDTNRLARRNINDTIITKRRKNRRTNIKSTGLDSFVEPTSPYNAQYPYNKVQSTESGHVMEFDDTFGAERINIFHTTGTFIEIDANGNQTNKIVGDNFSITESNGYIYIDGMARVSVGGDVKLRIGGNFDIDVDGDVNWTVKGSINTKVGQNTVTNVTGNSIYNIKGTTVSNHIGNCSYNAQGAFAITAKSLGIFASTTMNLTAASMNLGTSGNMDINSKKLNLNSGKPATTPNLPTAPVVAPALNTSVSPINYNNPDNFVDSEIISLDDSSDADVAAHQEKLIQSGIITQKQIDTGKEIADKPPAKVDAGAPGGSNQPLPESCALFDGPDGLNENIQISKSFTLAMVSTKTVVSKNKIIAQRGLTVQQIACNLKRVAENCLDQIKSQYPNMFVTSGFRPINPRRGPSQHELGEAIDMQFTGANKSDFYTIAVWIKNNVVFDKLLLEYKTTNNGNPWIHIAYRPNPRSEVYTYMNDGKVSNDIRKLQ